MVKVVVQNNDDHYNCPVKKGCFKVQMKLYSVSQSFVLHVYRHFNVFLGAYCGIIYRCNSTMQL